MITRSLTLPLLHDAGGRSIAQTRNVVGFHFNALAFNLLDSDALEFGGGVLKLMDLLVDAEAGWSRSDKSGSYWATLRETRRLYPLRRPQK